LSDPRPHLDPERLRRARSYRAFQVRLLFASTAATVVVMLALHFAGAGVALRDATRGLAYALDAYVIVMAVGVAGWLAQLPFAYASWRRGRREGLVVQSLPGAFADSVKGLALTLVLLGIPLALWYRVLTRTDWPLITLGGVAVLSLFATLLGPALTSLFFRFDPLGDETVAQRVRTVAQRAGVRVSGVYRIGLGAKTTAANAMVIGIGPTKRIALGDTLLAHFPIDEVEAVVAHEVGHDVSGDPARYVLAFTLAGTAALIAVRIAVDAMTCGVASIGGLPQPVCGTEPYARVAGAADPASYPLVAALLTVAAFLGRPALMAFTRWREAAADAFGARYTSREAMGRAFVRLADQNLADPEPPQWEVLLFYSHPPIAERVRRLGLRWEELAT
jgi:STE24 endopeptidase